MNFHLPAIRWPALPARIRGMFNLNDPRWGRGEDKPAAAPAPAIASPIAVRVAPIDGAARSSPSRRGSSAARACAAEQFISADCMALASNIRDFFR